MKIAIDFKNVKFSYRPELPVLDIETLSINCGERIFIHGPSGCGKTTFLGLIAGILEIQSGQMTILNQRMDDRPQLARDHFRGSHMGYIFQMFNLIPYLNAYENIVLPCQINPERVQRIPDGIEASVRELASALGIESLLQKKVTDLSVGQQQRIAAARALLGKPEIIIADEPTSALDSDHRKSFLDLLLSQAAVSKATVLFVSHDRELARFLIAL